MFGSPDAPAQPLHGAAVLLIAVSDDTGVRARRPHACPSVHAVSVAARGRTGDWGAAGMKTPRPVEPAAASEAEKKEGPVARALLRRFRSGPWSGLLP